MTGQAAGHTRLRVTRAGIDTYQQPVVYMHRDCEVCRSEGFAAMTRVRLDVDARTLVATLNVVVDDRLGLDEIALSEAAWTLLDPMPDALAWVDKAGKILTQSQYSIIRAAACEPSEPPALKATNHHELVKIGAKHLVFEEKITGGQLGRPSGARFRTYERLLKHIEELKGTLFEGDVVSLKPVIDGIYRYPLRPSANDTLNRQLRSGISNDQLAEICLSLWQEERLCQVQEDDSEKREPQLICSLGLVNAGGDA